MREGPDISQIGALIGDRVGRTIEVTVVRGGSIAKVPLTVGERPRRTAQEG